MRELERIFPTTIPVEYSVAIVAAAWARMNHEDGYASLAARLQQEFPPEVLREALAVCAEPAHGNRKEGARRLLAEALAE